MRLSYSIGFIQKRLLVMILLITFLFLAIGLRLSIVQIINGQWLQAKALDQWTRDLPLEAERGLIFDSSGNALVENASTYDCYVRPKNVKNSTLVAEILSSCFELPYSSVYKKVTDKTSSEHLIKLQVSDEKRKKIIEGDLEGVVFSENIKRKYPFGNLFTQVIGFTTTDNVGQAGLEAYYNDYLKGVKGSVLTQADVKGINLDNSLEYYLPAISGLNINTTFDSAIQVALEEAMEICYLEQKAKNVTAIVMKPKTGEIVALACKPSFDLNNVPREDVASLMQMTKNLAVVDVYEPGSTFKILTSAVALNEEVVTVNEGFYDPGYRIVDGEKIKCWKHVGHGSQSFQDGFCNSCNAVFVDLALRLGKEKLYQNYYNFGLGQTSGIDILGESAGILMNIDSAKTVDVARMGFGQAIAVSPLQLITALCATVNGGNLMKPYITKSIVSSAGSVVFENAPTVVRRVISEEVSGIIRVFLEDAVGRPNGNYTFIPGYSVGGKTGTTQKYENGSISGKYIASFFGTFPANDPEYTILFIVDEPGAGAYYGSICATPYAKMVFEQIIKLKNYQPVTDIKEVEKVVVPDVVGLTLFDACNKLIEVGLRYEIGGEGERVVSQFVKAGEKVNIGQIIQINT